MCAWWLKLLSFPAAPAMVSGPTTSAAVIVAALVGWFGHTALQPLDAAHNSTLPALEESAVEEQLALLPPEPASAPAPPPVAESSETGSWIVAAQSVIGLIALECARRHGYARGQRDSAAEPPRRRGRRVSRDEALPARE